MRWSVLSTFRPAKSYAFEVSVMYFRVMARNGAPTRLKFEPWNFPEVMVVRDSAYCFEDWERAWDLIEYGGEGLLRLSY